MSFVRENATQKVTFTMLLFLCAATFFPSLQSFLSWKIFLPPKTFLTIQSCKGTKCQCIILLAHWHVLRQVFQCLKACCYSKEGILNLVKKADFRIFNRPIHIPLGFRAVLISYVTLAKEGAVLFCNNSNFYIECE